MDNFSPNQCPQCGKAIVGRSDKKFCDAYCRNSFNNQHITADEQYIKMTNTIIRKNRRILKTLCPEGKATVRREILETMGYDFRYFSGLYTSGKSKLRYFLLYDYAFAPIYDHEVAKSLIVQRQTYMNQHSDVWSGYI